MGLEVVRSEYSDPMNDLSGWYVQLKGTRDEVMSDEARELAMEEAAENGYDPHGQRDVNNLPSKKDYLWGDGMYSRSFWFYTRG